MVGLYFSSPTGQPEHGSSGAVGVQHPRLTKPGPLLGPQRILSRDQKNTSEELLGQPWIVTWTWNLIICFTHEICICKHIRKYFKIQWKPSCAKNSVPGCPPIFLKNMAMDNQHKSLRTSKPFRCHVGSGSQPKNVAVTRYKVAPPPGYVCW